MASVSVQNPPAAAASKAPKKKKANKSDSIESSGLASATPEKAASAAGDNQDDVSDAPHIRELKKNVRNVSKKITNLVKIEEKVAEHPDKSLEELVSLKIINADQKASIQKKPTLQSQLAQFEEQLAQAKKLEQDYRTRLAEFEKTLADKYEKEKAELVAETKDKAAAEAEASLKEKLLVLSQFLRLAAARRAEDSDGHEDENQALEGVLLNVYSGDDNAVANMLKLVHGADEPTPSTTGDLLKTTFAEVKNASVSHAASFHADAAAAETEGAESSEPQTDPTVANAGLTEINDGSAVALTNGHTTEAPASDVVPTNADVADGAANAAGESQWDTSADQANDMALSQEWVDVKRESSEIETGATAPPAAAGNSQSWADDHPEPHEVAAASADTNDGFHQVQRNRGNREGGFRGGRGDRGGYRGRGGRGDGRGRGRGRGGDRGDRGGRGGMPSRPRPAPPVANAA